MNIKANSNSPQCSPCSLIVISDHTAHHTHEWSIFLLYANSCAVSMLILILYSVMGVMFTKWEMFFFITFPYLPFLFPLHITGKYKPSKKSSTKFYKILQWIFVKLILIRIHKLPWQQEIKQNLSPSCLSQTGKIRIPFQYGSTTSYIKKIFIINNKKIC